MKIKKTLFLLPFALLLASCAMGNNYGPFNDGYCIVGGEEYLDIVENEFVDASEQSNSTFSLDSSSAAYTNLRSSIQNNYIIQKNQIIIEQLINYFDYSYPAPNNTPVAIYNETSVCPWNEEHLLSSIAVKTKKVELNDNVANNYVLLIDVSGSMNANNKLPLVKKGFCYLVDGLNDNDRVSIVTYASGVSTPLIGAKGSEKTKIKRAINDLSAGGGTYGESGIKKAYSLASDYYIEDGNNMILLATDGDFNIGVSNFNELEELVSKQRSRYNIGLSTFGFGMGNYKDSNMQTLALNGNGNVYYVDTELEAEKLFTGDLSSILSVVAKDSKIQVSFNADSVDKYRLVGYENKLLTEDEFNDDRVDAGEIFSNRCVIALYEIIPSKDNPNELFDITFKYKDPLNEENEVLNSSSNSITSLPSFDHIFASSVAEFALVLRDSKFKGTASYSAVIERLESREELQKDVCKQEFVELVRKVLVDEIVAR